MHSVLRHDEAASSDVKGAEQYVKKFSSLIAKEGYLPQQVFNCDETGLLEKNATEDFHHSRGKEEARA